MFEIRFMMIDNVFLENWLEGKLLLICGQVVLIWNAIFQENY